MLSFLCEVLAGLVNNKQFRIMRLLFLSVSVTIGILGSETEAQSQLKSVPKFVKKKNPLEQFLIRKVSTIYTRTLSLKGKAHNFHERESPFHKGKAHSLKGKAHSIKGKLIP